MLRSTNAMGMQTVERMPELSEADMVVFHGYFNYWLDGISYERELLISHGRFTQNQLTLWKYPSMVKTSELTGHTSRVPFMAQDPIEVIGRLTNFRCLLNKRGVAAAPLIGLGCSAFDRTRFLLFTITR
ncbi:hypothetical protein Dsin_011925 [Dipteronia sinensis]|uniref:Uncharacterized protein n=1 Tax=Dipteronia sinensis TaxID=43782 RepID=A0AAE0AHP6_9ROSI|nr:hypothetical protein Dsin_011925 [Dipteronia sinensis]